MTNDKIEQHKEDAEKAKETIEQNDSNETGNEATHEDVQQTFE
ncbi:hypothetical protein GCM10007190_02580 [Macrococcus hajekii]|nr:hypothetical protein [Macrococcus hajekii]GGA98040.1 hypothetical protein GCM10007190_02580 [Macrococcus hajekii]